MANFNLYNATHKTWDHIGNITPNVEYSEAVRPHGEYMPADWLPVGRYDKYYEDYFVVSVGKVVAFDFQGRVVPAGLKTAFAATGGDVLTYTATDVTEKTVDLTTGAVVAAACGYTRTELTAALIGRGLITSDQNAEDFISFPIGVAPYNYMQWAGGDGFNPADEKRHNYNMQHRVAILCKYVIEVPLVPAVASLFDAEDATGISDSAIADWTTSDAQGAWFSATALSLTPRYAASVDIGDDVVALNMAVMNVAKNTVLTPMTLPATPFVREVASIAELTTAGDYLFDLPVGVILFFSSGGTAAITMAHGSNITVYTYDAAPASVGTYACAVGDLKPGDFVRADANSNFCKARVFTAADADVSAYDPNASADEPDLVVLLNGILTAQREIVGQVLDSEVWPKDYLDRVRTAYPQLGTLDQMPGSASGGMPAAVTYAGAADKTIRILLLK